MVEKSDIKKCFSKQLDWIKDSELQDKVVEVWKKAIDVRGWKSLDEITHIIYAHSPEGDKTKRSPEAIIVNHCDFIDFQIKKIVGVDT